MYQNIFINRRNETVFLWDDQKGKIEFPLFAIRYAYRKKAGGEFKSLYGDELEEVSYYDDNDRSLFESDVPLEVKALSRIYQDSDDPSEGHRVGIIDIEVDSTGGFPNIEKGDKTITCIAIYDTPSETFTSFVLDPDGRIVSRTETTKFKDSDTKQYTWVIKSYKTEKDMLLAFINKWEEYNFTIITGWASNGFDLPYIYNRIKVVLGKKQAYRLSCIEICYMNQFTKTMRIAGMSCLDYLELYKKFIGKDQPSFSLGYIGQEEVGIGKTQYRGSLVTLYKEDLDKYVEYNMTDVKIVAALEQKLDFIYLARSVCHKGHVPYEWFMFSSRWIDGALLTYLHRHNLVAPNKPEGGKEAYEAMKAEGEEGFEGAYVKDPMPGLYDWVYSADVTSLYPSVIMSLNISPEKKIAKIDNWDTEKFVNGEIKSVIINGVQYIEEQFREIISNNKVSISSNGIMYKNDEMGLVPEVLNGWFDERVEYKKLAEEFKERGDKEKEAFYDRRQKRQKIFLNCFSPDTKVITKNGIKLISELKVGDLVYSLNKESGTTELKPVTRTYEYDYEGDMVHFQSRHVDFLTTPNHRFWLSKMGKKNYKKFSWEYSGDVIKDKVRRKFPIIHEFPSFERGDNDIDLAYYASFHGLEYSFRGTCEEEIRIIRSDDARQGRHTTFIPRYYNTEDWLEFLGWYISEGSLYTSTPKKYSNGNSRGITYRIHIAQEKYHNEVKSLLIRMKLPFHEDARGFSIANDVLYAILKHDCGFNSETKKIPDWVFHCSADKLKHLYKSLMMGDGHVRGNCYTTKSGELKDGFLRLCFHIGEVYAFLRDYDGCYRIQINDVKGKGCTLKSIHRKLVPYKGKVYCVEVQDNHTLLCGRNDKYQWSGQSVYGTLGLPIFRFYDRDNAEATTVSGQHIIKMTERYVNMVYADRFAAKGKSVRDDHVIYIDTDSVYMSAKPLMELEPSPPADPIQYTIDLAGEISSGINEFYNYAIPAMFNLSKHRIKITPDVIASTGFWVKKKRYALMKVYDMEKRRKVVEKDGTVGKLEVKGIDVVRTSFPARFRKFSSELLNMILRRCPQNEIDDRILQMEKEIKTLPVDEVAKNTSVTFISKKGDANYNPPNRKMFTIPTLKTPPQVGAALMYNDFLGKFGLQKQFEPIHSGQKIKWVYLKENPYALDYLAMKADGTDPDEILEIINTYVDRKAMYEKELKTKIAKFYTVMRWIYPTITAKIASKFFHQKESLVVGLVEEEESDDEEVELIEVPEEWT